MATRDGNKYDEYNIYEELTMHPLYEQALSMVAEERREHVQNYIRTIAQTLHGNIWTAVGKAMQEEAASNMENIPEEKITKDN